MVDLLHVSSLVDLGTLAGLSMMMIDVLDQNEGFELEGNYRNQAVALEGLFSVS